MSEFAMPKYDYTCTACDVYWELERPMADANAPTHCPLCGEHGARVYTMPKLLFKADPRDVRPVWHNHEGYSHAHAPRRGRHKTPGEDH
ncbi:MAG: FmdB family zinc ribbon protein [Chloroflexota bacterium]